MGPELGSCCRAPWEELGGARTYKERDFPGKLGFELSLPSLSPLLLDCVERELGGELLCPRPPALCDLPDWVRAQGPHPGICQGCSKSQMGPVALSRPPHPTPHSTRPLAALGLPKALRFVYGCGGPAHVLSMSMFPYQGRARDQDSLLECAASEKAEGARAAIQSA